MNSSSSEPRERESLSWATRPFVELIRLSWPITVSMLSYSVMTLAGTLFVSSLGASALAGVGLGGTAAFAVLCFSFGLLRGVKVVVSQAVGAGQRHEVGAYLAAGLVIALVAGVVTIGAGELLAPFMTLIAATPESGADARAYLEVRVLGAPLVLLFVALREARYGVSDARSPMIASVAGNAANLVLDYVLVIRLDQGVAGAAWGTVAGHFVEAGILFALQSREGLRLSKIAVRHLAGVWRYGFPTAVQFMLEVGSFSVLAAMLASLSETEMAAHQIALQIIHLSFLPSLAVGEAASVLAGQAIGANRDDLVRVVARHGLWASTVYTGSCSLAFVLAGTWIVSPFTTEPRLFVTALHLLWVAAIFQVFDGANIIARGTLRGTGDVRYAAVIGIVTSWLLTPPFTWLLGYHFGLGALGGWIGLCAEIIIGSGLVWWRLERGGWRAAAREARRVLGSNRDGAPSIALATTEAEAAE